MLRASEMTSGQLALTLEPGGPSGGWNIRVSKRSRRMAIRVYPGGSVEIVVPEGTAARFVEGFVARHREWIARKVEEFGCIPVPDPQALPATVDLPAIGRRLLVEYVDRPGRAVLRESGELLQVGFDGQRPLLARHQLNRWLLRTAHAHFVPSLLELSSAHGLGFRRVQVRRQKTRWGSCSRSGTISLNACLLFHPPEVVKYLMLHELAHTVHMNHGRRFWALVGQLEPDWRRLDRELSRRAWERVPGWAQG